MTYILPLDNCHNGTANRRHLQLFRKKRKKSYSTVDRLSYCKQSSLQVYAAQEFKKKEKDIYIFLKLFSADTPEVHPVLGKKFAHATVSPRMCVLSYIPVQYHCFFFSSFSGSCTPTSGDLSNGVCDVVQITMAASNPSDEILTKAQPQSQLFATHANNGKANCH